MFNIFGESMESKRGTHFAPTSEARWAFSLKAGLQTVENLKIAAFNEFTNLIFFHRFAV